MKYKEKYLELSLDLNKRHFIFGDIHGNYQGMIELLDRVNYDPSADVIYCVGDMIDRGPENLNVVDFFLDQENTFSCRGNHEEMIIDSTYHSTWLSNGGLITHEEICRRYPEEPFNGGTNSVQNFVETIKYLPFVIDIGNEKDDQRFRIIHAEFPEYCNEHSIQQELMEEDPSFMAGLLWSRKDITQFKKFETHGRYEEIRKLSNWLKERQPVRTFSGHTPLKNVTNIGNRYYIDTGWKTLTMINALTLETYTL